MSYVISVTNFIFLGPRICSSSSVGWSSSVD